MTHTPGPWKVVQTHGVRQRIIRQATRSGSYVAEVSAAKNGTDLGPEDIANAWLISSAPDLLQALKDLLTEVGETLIEADAGYETGISDHEVLIERWAKVSNNARAAIKKAEGQS